MKIVVVTLTYNEEVILPFFLRHYERFVERIIIFDSGSTDRTPEIARAHPLVELRERRPTNGEIDDMENVRLKNTAWKDCGADWVIVVDADEFLFHPDMRAFLNDCGRQRKNLVQSECWQMVGVNIPSEGLLTEQITMGVRDAHTIQFYDKTLIFKPETNINYVPGCHHYHGENLRQAAGQPVILLHYKWLSLDYLKRKASALKLSAVNDAYGHGYMPDGAPGNTVWVDWYKNVGLPQRRELEFLTWSSVQAAAAWPLREQLAQARAEAASLRQAVESKAGRQGKRRERKGMLRRLDQSYHKRRKKIAWWLFTHGHRQLASWLWSRLDTKYSTNIVIPPVIEAMEISKALKNLAFPVVVDPKISIIIPTYGKLAVTLTCLRSIAANMPSIPIEVIVLEDCSNDTEIDRLANVPGLLYMRHSKNLGYLRSNNSAADFAKGEYLHLLNNDTQVTSGWLDAMLEVFRTRPDCGLVGSKLVFPDGRLQEAGAIIWNDASGRNFGREDNPSNPEFNYLRETDFCAGASLLVRRDFFDELGRFDELYVPAYFEDTDLAFKVRAAGRKLYYQPKSTVVHYEGVSHGAGGTGIKQTCMVANQRKFLEKWREALDRENFPDDEHIFWARDRSRHRKTVLVIGKSVPKPDHNAGSQSMMRVIQSFLSMGFNVKFWPHDLRYDPVHTLRLQALGVEVEYGPRQTGRFKKWLEPRAAYIDYVLLSQPDISAAYLSALRRQTRATLLDYSQASWSNPSFWSQIQPGNLPQNA